MRFPGKRLAISGGYLQQLEPDDVKDVYVEGLNNPIVNKYLEVRHKVNTLKTVKEFVSANANSEDGVLWGVWIESRNTLIGSLRLHDINLDIGCCSIGVCIFDKSAWGQGLASSSIRSATSWAFNQFNLTKIKAGIHPENLASRNAFLNAGFEFVPETMGNSLISDNSLVSDDASQVGVYIASPAFSKLN